METLTFQKTYRAIDTQKQGESALPGVNCKAFVFRMLARARVRCVQLAFSKEKAALISRKPR